MSGLAFYVTLDNGGSWRVITPPYVAAMGDPMARLAGFDAIGKEDYWFAAEDVFLPGPSVNGSLRGSVVEFTTDGGHRWGASQQFRTGNGIEMSMVTTKVGYLLGGPDLYETTDGGARWEVVGRAPVRGAGLTIELVFANRQDGWAVQGGSLYRTTDGGRSWGSVELRAPAPYRDLDRTISAPRFFTPNDGVFTMRFYGTADGTQPIVVYVTHDAGKNWAAVPAPLDPSSWALQKGYPADDFSAVSMTQWALYVGPGSPRPPTAAKWSWTVPTPAWTASKIVGIDFWSLDDGWLNVLDNTCTPKQAAQLGVACINPVLVSTSDAGHTWAAKTP